MMLLGYMYLQKNLVKKFQLYRLLLCVQRWFVLLNIQDFYDFAFEPTVRITRVSYFKISQVYCFVVII